MTTIQVRKPFSWFGDPITVQFGYKDEDGYFELEDCNHAGAYTEISSTDYPNPNGPDMTDNVLIEQCDKCPAWRVVADSPNHMEWQYE